MHNFFILYLYTKFLNTEQIDALLPHVRPKESRIKPLDEFLRLLYTFLTSLPPRSPAHPLEAARALQKQGINVPYPIPQPSEGVKWTVAFERPSEVNVVGSWPNKIGAKAASGPAWMVDLALEMPVVRFPALFSDQSL